MLMSSNIAFLAFLYFVQGLPNGLQTRFLPIYFRTHGMSLSKVGFFRLLFLPWMLKALWAPLVDRFGTKKLWLIWSMLGIAGTTFIGSFSGPDRLAELTAILFLFNILTSTQDIAVDALAIQILSSSELSHGNIAQVVAYKFGSLCGGGLFIWLSDYFTWMALFQLLSLVYLTAVITAAIFVPKQPRCVITIIVPDPQTDLAPSQNESEAGSEKADVLENQLAASTSSFPAAREVQEDLTGLNWLTNHLSLIMSSEGTMWTICYVFVYKLGEQGTLSMISLYLLDRKMAAAVVGFWTGVVGLVISMLGSFIGGWAVSAYKLISLSSTTALPPLTHSLHYHYRCQQVAASDGIEVHCLGENSTNWRHQCDCHHSNHV
ncbi:major facilitator superfamily domain-containing protein 3-like isoform X2 [Gigantopelta aegis]|uniref:major facilitator superfamily domain-containing protein 3-like isoform X2 n=1 Tax=Gigantopelta aegis TaxID=1735272 RepID=UPI001B887537|nr:major facilitator superfamily domain-containing protein 3-like isoform X2 [Gigantopelta aegis]